MKLPAICLWSLVLVLCPAAPAAAQTAKKAVKKVDPAVEYARKRCEENRGVDCDTRDGLREWLAPERRITREEQQAAAAARRHRETCARTKGKAAGC